MCFNLLRLSKVSSYRSGYSTLFLKNVYTDTKLAWIRSQWNTVSCNLIFFPLCWGRPQLKEEEKKGARGEGGSGGGHFTSFWVSDVVHQKSKFEQVMNDTKTWTT